MPWKRTLGQENKASLPGSFRAPSKARVASGSTHRLGKTTVLVPGEELGMGTGLATPGACPECQGEGQEAGARHWEAAECKNDEDLEKVRHVVRLHAPLLVVKRQQMRKRKTGANLLERMKNWPKRKSQEKTAPKKIRGKMAHRFPSEPR